MKTLWIVAAVVGLVVIAKLRKHPAAPLASAQPRNWDSLNAALTIPVLGNPAYRTVKSISLPNITSKGLAGTPLSKGVLQ